MKEEAYKIDTERILNILKENEFGIQEPKKNVYKCIRNEYILKIEITKEYCIHFELYKNGKLKLQTGYNIQFEKDGKHEIETELLKIISNL